MRFRTNYIIRLAVALFSIALTTPAWIGAPSSTNAQDKKDAAKDGAVFKVPDGYMQAPMSEFRGVMMLDPKRPAGMFVTYPQDNETTEALRQRVLTFIAPMFIHDDKDKAEPTITWDTKPLPSHSGDGDGKATVNTYSGSTQELQVAVFERTTGPRPLLYGYFAMRHKKPKGDDGKFLDQQGQGVKAFDKLWQSFSK